MSEKRLTYQHFSDMSGCQILNDEGLSIGYLEKIRHGRWETFGLYLNNDCYVTAGCLDEIRAKMKEMNATMANKKKVNKKMKI